MSRPKTHKDVEYAVDDSGGQQHTFKKFADAAEFALMVGMSTGEAKIDVLVWSRAGAKHVAGDDGVEAYEEDPDASVFERYEIRVNAVGRVP